MDVKIRGARFKFVNTHLLSPITAAISQNDFAITSALQQAQASELLDALSATGLPVILAGDFNSDAESPQYPPDNTPTAGIITSSGYEGVWHLLNPEVMGYTWPLFFEDQLSAFNPTSPFERIDLIFSRGPVPGRSSAQERALTRLACLRPITSVSSRTSSLRTIGPTYRGERSDAAG